MRRERASELVGELSSMIFKDEGALGYDKFRKINGYTSLIPDSAFIEKIMCDHGERVLDALLGSLTELGDEMVQSVIDGDASFITTVQELNWILAFGGHMFANCHISARVGEFIPCPPSVSLVRNIDRKPLEIRRLPLEGSFEEITKIDIKNARTEIILPGETFYVDGFRDMLWYTESGIMLFSLTTLPLGSYEAVFCRETGRRSGIFSSDLRHSSTVVVLRCFAAFGWLGARILAKEAASHPIKEIRWAALNYFWRMAGSDVIDEISIFLDDPDHEIKNLATNCLSVIQSQDIVDARR